MEVLQLEIQQLFYKDSERPLNGNDELNNDDISQWDVSKVTDMARMFYSAERFNQDLSQWNMEKC